MRAGAVLSLLVCLVAVSQGLEILLNPELDGCENGDYSPVTSWTGSGGSLHHDNFVNLFTTGSIPSGDVCLAFLDSDPTNSHDSLTQTITITTAGTYDFSALAACYGDPSGLFCDYVLTIDGSSIPLSVNTLPGNAIITYFPVTASAISLTAGTHSFVFKMNYATQQTVQTALAKMSLVFVAAASGDPHMVGFQGQQFDYIGQPGQVVNLITDPELQVNSLLGLQKVGENSFFPGPVMMEMAFMTRGHTVIVNAGGYLKEEIGFVSVDGVLLPLGHSFLDGLLSVAFTALNINSKDLGLTGNDHIVAQVDIKLEGMYEFRVFMIENGKDNLHHAKWLTDYPRRFLDFNASLLDLDRRPHGVLGQTAAPLGKERSVNDWTIEGKDEDYVVKDGLTGSQFSFNLF